MSSPTPPATPAPTPPERALELCRHLSLVTQAAGIGYWSQHLRTGDVLWSDEVRMMHGLPADSPALPLDTWLERYVHADDRGRLRAALDAWRATAEGALELGFRVVRDDGQQREVLSHTVAEEGPAGPVLFGVLIDVTALRSAERARREAEGRAALAARAVGMGTWEVDVRSGQAIWDGQMWALRGRPARDAAPGLEQRLAMVHPEDRETMRQVDDDSSASHHEFRVVWPDGQVRWLATRRTVLRDDSGAPVRRIGVNWDITAARQAEAALREQEVALRASQERTRLLSRISHELLTPLNAVIGCAQLLQDEAKGDGAAATLARERARQVQESGHQLLAMVDKVLELTRESPPPVATLRVAPQALPRHVLYIEDNAVNALIVTELVARRPDLRVAVAATGTEGIAMAAELRPALILLDMRLPDLDGLEVFRRLRADERTAGIRCIALSANAQPGDVEAARAAGMTDYWIKPLDFGAFMAALEHLFGPAPGG